MLIQAKPTEDRSSTYHCSVLLLVGRSLVGLGPVGTVLGQRGVWTILVAVCVSVGSRLAWGGRWWRSASVGGDLLLLNDQA